VAMPDSSWWSAVSVFMVLEPRNRERKPAPRLLVPPAVTRTDGLERRRLTWP
jgi:hypothetical protein